jgi:hypothetical protein
MAKPIKKIISQDIKSGQKSYGATPYSDHPVLYVPGNHMFSVGGNYLSNHSSNEHSTSVQSLGTLVVRSFGSLSAQLEVSSNA